MQRLTKLGASLVMVLLAISAVASDFEFSSDSIAVADDGTTIYTGNVVIRAPAATPLKVESKTVREENGVQTLEGDVRITLGDMLIKTQKATLKKGKDIVIEMDDAESTTL